MSSSPQALAQQLRGRIDAVVIGASAGAIEALTALLPALPPGFTLPVAVVVHLSPHHESLIASLFSGRCKVAVKEAEDKEPFSAGTVYFAAPNYHLLVEPQGHLSLSSEEPVLFSRPSIDLLFESALDAYQERLLAVVLTGANSDGARGLGRICEAGGVGVVQAPGTAASATMPEAALRTCPSAQALTLEEIAALLAALGAPQPGEGREVPQP